ncbi:unnamed protein product [Polarella glacialis]|uniref:Uncharacterized protein n=1 Tax=Polarella glacialis TaxID=89957 RepID=A0A813EP30_POLGL|nr:unnamed protein product [Polarella glacialis]
MTRTSRPSGVRHVMPWRQRWTSTRRRTKILQSRTLLKSTGKTEVCLRNSCKI